MKSFAIGALGAVAGVTFLGIVVVADIVSTRQRNRSGANHRLDNLAPYTTHTQKI